MALERVGKYLRITVQHKGERVRFKWPEPANEASIAAAERASHRIKRDLEDGVYKGLEDYLPQSAGVASFGVLAKSWLRSSDASDATRNEYRKALNRYWLPTLGSQDVSKLRPSQLKSVIQSQTFTSAKTKNNALIPLRQILGAAFIDEFTLRPLDAFVKSEKFQKRPPDPFSKEEAEKIIEHFKETHWHNYFEFMFYSGLRTGEALGLQWDSIDFKRGCMSIHRSQSKGRSLDSTKTNRSRDVRLNERSENALKSQRKVSMLRGGDVWVTESGVGYRTEKAQRAAFTAALKALGIRHRPQYNTRHTYATMLLMAGANPVWVANQMGHSVQVLFERYGKWLNGDDDAREMAKLNVK